MDTIAVPLHDADLVLLSSFAFLWCDSYYMCVSSRWMLGFLAHGALELVVFCAVIDFHSS